MFSIFKKVSDEQEVVLQELTEEQMIQAAGGCDYGYKRNDHDWDDSRHMWMKRHHHKHHKHHHMSDWDQNNSWSMSSSYRSSYGENNNHW